LITETNKLSRLAAIYIGVTSNGTLYATNQLTQTAITAMLTNALLQIRLRAPLICTAAGGMPRQRKVGAGGTAIHCAND